MWPRQVLVLGMYVLVTMKLARSSGSRFNAGTSAGSQNPQLKLEMNAWQPFTQHNNWLILQATAPSSQITERRTEPERLPGNYYAYNHRYNESVAPSAGGNYKQVPPTDPAEYVLAISQQMRRGQILRQLPPVKEAEPEPEPEVREVATTLTQPSNGDDDGDGDGENANEIDPLDDEGAGELVSLRAIGAYLAPFERALVKVRDFCDTLRTAINGEAGG